MQSLLNQQQDKMAARVDESPPNTLTMGRKRSRIGLAAVASAIAISVSAVSAFQSPLPFVRSPSTATAASATTWNPSATSGNQRQGTSLNVLAEPDTSTLLRDQIELIPSALNRRPLNGSKKVKRKVPPKLTLTPTSRAAKAAKSTKDAQREIQKMARVESTTSAVKAKSKPARKKAKKTERQTSTMPGFGGGEMTDRQQAFRDGIKLVERRTGKNLSKYVDTPEARKKRRQVNGEAMYKTSASVPESLVQFANEIHKVERITPKEEVELGEKTQEAIRLQNLHDDLTDKLSRPPTDEEWCAAAGKINLEAISQAIEDGLEAKNMLVTSNLRMVQGVVNTYIRNGLGAEYNAGDLMQEGIMALIRAAEKFDPTRGFRFSTYAMYWIRAAVKRSQIVQSRPAPVPQRLYENHKRILRTESEMRVALRRKPTNAEVGAAIGMSEVQVERCLAAMSQRFFSLDQGIRNTKKPMGSDRSTDTLIEIVHSKTDEGDYNKLKHIFLREDLIETLNRHLSPEEVELLLLRYGLHEDIPAEFEMGPMTIANVSRVVGLKPDKVRRMINKSLKHLQVVIYDEWRDYEQELQF